MQNTDFFSQNTESFFMGCTGLHVCFSGSNRDHRRSSAFYVDLIIQILKFRNVNVTHECICLQLDTPGSFELIKTYLFLILMSIFFSFKSPSNKNDTCLHVATHTLLFHNIYINARHDFFPN